MLNILVSGPPPPQMHLHVWIESLFQRARWGLLVAMGDTVVPADLPAASAFCVHAPDTRRARLSSSQRNAC